MDWTMVQWHPRWALLVPPAFFAKPVDRPAFSLEQTARIQSGIQAQNLESLDHFIKILKSSGKSKVLCLLPYFDALFLSKHVCVHVLGCFLAWLILARQAKRLAAMRRAFRDAPT
jgi:hypothetical protein